MVRSALIAAMLTWLMTGCASTPNVDRTAADVETLSKDALSAWQRAEFASLRGKTSPEDSGITLSMRQADELPTEEQRRAMLAWADELSVFARRSEALVRRAVPSHLAPLVVPIYARYNKREIDLAIAMYPGQLSWGRYNYFRIESQEQLKRELNEATILMGMTTGNGAVPELQRTNPSPVELFLLSQPPHPGRLRAPVTAVRRAWAFVSIDVPPHALWLPR